MSRSDLWAEHAEVRASALATLTSDDLDESTLARVLELWDDRAWVYDTRYEPLDPEEPTPESTAPPPVVADVARGRLLELELDGSPATLAMLLDHPPASPTDATVLATLLGRTRWEDEDAALGMVVPLATSGARFRDLTGFSDDGVERLVRLLIDRSDPGVVELPWRGVCSLAEQVVHGRLPADPGPTLRVLLDNDDMGAIVAMARQLPEATLVAATIDPSWCGEAQQAIGGELHGSTSDLLLERLTPAIDDGWPLQAFLDRVDPWPMRLQNLATLPVVQGWLRGHLMAMMLGESVGKGRAALQALVIGEAEGLADPVRDYLATWTEDTDHHDRRMFLRSCRLHPFDGLCALLIAHLDRHPRYAGECIPVMLAAATEADREALTAFLDRYEEGCRTKPGKLGPPPMAGFAMRPDGYYERALGPLREWLREPAPPGSR